MIDPQHAPNDHPASFAPSAGGGGAKRVRPSHKGVDLGAMTKSQLEKCLSEKSGIVKELRDLASAMRIRGHAEMRKPELIRRTVGKATNSNGFLPKLKRMSV